MLSVGVIGKNGKGIKKAFLRMAAGRANCYHITSGKSTGPKVNVVVASDASDVLKTVAQGLLPTDFLVVNADNKDIFPLLDQVAPTVITYGLNGRACITASSITTDKLQICIQRGFKGQNGVECIPQEFSTKVDFLENSHGVLAAAATLAVCGIFPPMAE